MLRRLLLTSAAALMLCSCGTPKDAWLVLMETTLPPQICGDDYFERCFTWPKDACKVAAKATMNACVDEIRADLPENLNPISGGKWGKELGACVGGRTAQDNLNQIVVTPQCAEVVDERMGPGSADGLREEAEAARAQQGEAP